MLPSPKNDTQNRSGQTGPSSAVRGEAVWMPTYDIEGVSVEFPHEAQPLHGNFLKGVTQESVRGDLGKARWVLEGTL